MAVVGGTMAGFAAAGIGAQLVAGAMIAGGAMTAIGAVTGSQKMQKFGGLLSLAGGVGGLASGAWASAASDVANNAQSAGFGGAEYGMADGTAQVAGNNPSAYLGGAGSATDSTAAMSIDQLTAANPAQTTPGLSNATPAAPTLTPPATTSPAIPVNGPNASPPGGGAAAPKSMLSSLGDTLSGATDWAQQGNNPRLVQAGAGLLQAGLGAVGQQEAIKTQIALQEAAQQRARDRLNASVTPLQMPTYKKG